jgi:steroid delta-isomerase-like uncharacterized protein
MTNDVEKTIKNWVAAWNSHDLDKTISFYTDDCVLEDNALGLVCHGKKELVAFCKSAFIDFPDLRFESKSLFNSGNWVAWEWTMTGTQTHSSTLAIKATGKRFSVRGASIIEIHNGKIKRETDYYNTLTVMQQLGLRPGVPRRFIEP